MNDRFSYQKQQLRKILLALEKIDFELQHYQRSISVDERGELPNVYNRFGEHSQDKSIALVTNKQTNIDLEAITDVGILEALLLERLTFFEKQYFAQGQATQPGQLSLVKQALFTLQSMQTLLEQYQRLETALYPMPRQQPLPLSYAQQGVLFLEQFDPGTARYNEHLALRLKGMLHLDALELSFSEMIRRHEILRTTFPRVGNETGQRIAAWQPYELMLIDLQDTPIQEREVRVLHMAEEKIQRPFDLVNGPLLKVCLFQLAEDEHILLTVFHHAIVDGWSISIIYRELAALYKAYSLGEASPLLELPIQYADYTLWQRQWLRGEVLQEQVDYWKLRLKGASTQLSLPTDRPRPPMQTYAGARQTLLLPLELLQQLKALSQSKNVTLFVTLLSAFLVLLMRYSGQQDILVGTPVANRPRRELEDVIGFFVNTLVLRADLSGNPSFEQLLGRMRETTIQAYAHQDLPFGQLVAALEPERTLGHHPLFQVAFAFQNFPLSTFTLPGISWSLLDVIKTTAKLDLHIGFREEQERLQVTVEYRTDLFDENTILRLIVHFQTMLEAIVIHPRTPIASLPLLTATEYEQLVHGWNTSVQEDMPLECLHELFSHQVQQRPDALALVFQDQHLSYEHLDRCANQLAHRLLECGVNYQSAVGLCLHRSVEQLIGLFAILKVGAVYVPLDPSYPIKRLHYILQDAQVCLVLTSRQTTSLLEHVSPRQLCLDPWEEHAFFSCDMPQIPTMPEQGAYLIYTSGSTGLPKGVLVSHRGLGHLARAQQATFQLQTSSRILQCASLNFDASIFEMVMALLAGATLYLETQANIMPGPDLQRTLRTYAITIVTLTPSSLALLPVEPLPMLETLVVAGEACPADLVRRWVHRHAFFNAYGPTETTIWASVDACQAEDASPLIGRPLPHTQIYLLDDMGEPVPIGVIGEIYIGGIGLAHGYLHRGDLTAEWFVPHPFSAQPGQRLYRTGDLARWREDGRLDFISRRDEQVKLRGYRIELGEIETVLGLFADVQECAVGVREEQPGDTRLVAYVVLKQGIEWSERALRTCVQESLPDYMVPAHFVCLETMPLTPNGKIDRQALRAHQLSTGVGERQDTLKGPRTAIEKMVADIWCDILDLEELDIRDNFFDLGGHSLLATQIIARIQALMAVELPVRNLFETPTVAELAEQIEQALRHEEGVNAPPLVSAPRTQPLPLSFAQQRLWFLDQLEPNNTAYNVPLALRLQGTLNIGILEQSLQALVNRHEILRTSFQSVNNQPVQIIGAMNTFHLEIIDLSRLAAEEYEVAMRYYVHLQVEHVFDLEQGPLLRALLLTTRSQREHLLLLTMHHIIVDGWSLGIFTDELAVLYKAFANGVSSPLPTLPIQYADFALWQRQWPQNMLQQQLDYWEHMLSGLATLELPTDRPRPVVQTFQGALRSMQVSEELYLALKRLSQQSETTLFMTLLCAFQVLLARYSGQTDIAVGTPIANRTRREVEGLIGFFANTLVLRSDLSGNPTFAELLAQVREVALGAYSHQDVPFEKLVEVLQPERDLSRSPLFQVMFILQDEPEVQTDWGEVRLSIVEQPRTSAKFDLIWELQITRQGLLCLVEYNTDLFDARTIERWFGHWQVLLESLVANPHCRISNLPILTVEERQQLLVEWNTTCVEREPDQVLHMLFEQQVQRCADSVALAFADEYLTYDVLNARANQLAHWLRMLGIGPEIIVGVAIERSLLLSISLLGIFKAGGAYLPLDPAYPEERLAYMVTDAQVSVLLTTESLRLHLPGLDTYTSACLPGQQIGVYTSQVADEHHCQIVYLDAAWNYVAPEEHSEEERPALHLQSTDNPVHLTAPDNLAYVIYTSGSTGAPKGVMVTHAGMLNHLWAKVETLELQETDVVAQTASQCFDISVWQLLAGLLRGGRVQIVPDILAHDPQSLLHTVELHSVTILQMVPSLLGPFLDELALHPLDSQWKMRWLIVTGEAMPQPLCRRWWQEQAEVRLLNAYGPTECSDDVSHALLAEQGVDEHSWRVPIGRPIANTQLYLLDERLEPVPLGVVGEIYVGGSGVGRGYLGHVERTATAFVPDPYSPELGRRLYRTGDRGKYQEDGQIEFVERQDEQVKLRGYRIELGEITEVLSAYPGIREAVVVMNESRPGEKHLAAYLVSRKPEQELAPDELRSYMQDKLPSYMIPSFFVSLEALPLTANGKIDRRALPDPGVQADRPGETALRERSPIEEVVTVAWCEVLGLGRAGIHDNFFEQGGHSLLATKLIARLRALVDVELPLRFVFEAPTIEGLARRVEQALRGDKQRKVSALIARERPEMVPLSFAQQRLWFLDQLEPENPAYNITGGVRLRGKLLVQALERSLAEIIQRHESLRTTFQHCEKQVVQIIHANSEFHLLQANLEGLSFTEREHEVQRLASEEGEHPFNLTLGPLLRVLLLRLSTEEHILLLTMHHIISDGWSLNVLVQELTTLYFAFVTGQPSPLAPLPVQYADFALWQRELLQGEVLDNLISYWQKQLKGALPLKLPTDRPAEAVAGNRGAVHHFTLSAQLSDDLLALSRQEGVTLFMLLLTAFQILLYRWTGQQDIVVGTDIANRTHTETEGIIGFFVNLLPLRSQLDDQDTFRSALRNVCAMALNAYVHQDLPFEQLINSLQLERKMRQIPLVNVLFVLQNIPPLAPEFQGLTVDLLDIETQRAKFDLAMFLLEGEQQITGYVNYRTDLFTANTVARLCTQLAILLQSAIASPDTAIADLEIYSEEEKKQRLQKELELQEARRNKLKTAKSRTKSMPGKNDGNVL